jgi:hypothetical protein
MSTTRSQTVPKKRKREAYIEQRPRQQDALDENWGQQALPEKQRLSIRQLAKRHDVRVATLTRLIADGQRFVETEKPGAKHALSRMLECMLAIWVLAQQAIGCSVYGKDIRVKAAKLEMINNGKPLSEATKPKDGHWLAGFMARFSFLNYRRSSNLATDRAQSSNPFVIRVFFALYVKLMATMGNRPIVPTCSSRWTWVSSTTSRTLFRRQSTDT